jgi:hypothetical protein
MDEQENMPPIFVHERDIQETLQYFFDNTEWGFKCGGHLPLKEEEWKRVIKEFKKYFNRDPIENEYVVTEARLYDFINNQIYQMVEFTMLEMTDAGLVEMVVDSNGNIAFQNKKEKL